MSDQLTIAVVTIAGTILGAGFSSWLGCRIAIVTMRAESRALKDRVDGHDRMLGEQGNRIGMLGERVARVEVLHNRRT